MIRQPALTDTQQWDARRALLDALKASHSLAQAAGIHLGEGHRKAIENAVNEVLLPLGQEHHHMIDSAEFLKRKGHSQPEVARLASEFGRALKVACTHTGHESVTNFHRFEGGCNDVRMYHAHTDAVLLDAVYRNFQQRELYQRVCAGRDAQTDLMVEEALRDGRGTAASREMARQRRGAGRGRGPTPTPQSTMSAFRGGARRV